MTETYAQAIRAARERYKVAMDEAAANALLISKAYGTPLATVCKDIAEDAWKALDSRARRLEAKGSATQAALRSRARASAERHAKAVLKDPERRRRLIASLPSQPLDDLYHEARLARANIDSSPANRQAAKAAASSTVEPIKRAIAQTSAALGLQALVEARDDLRDAIGADAITPSQINKADALVNEIANLLMEAKFQTGARA